ncbi:MAG: diguanylate cyclase [Acidobacteria bacterium]|nr:diguanylate cyclase [Acidobacteriota bacterium]
MFWPILLQIGGPLHRPPPWLGGGGPLPGGHPPLGGLHGAMMQPFPGTQHVVGVVVWGLLLTFVCARYRSDAASPGRRLLALGFGVGLIRQVLMLAVEALGLRRLAWLRPGSAGYVTEALLGSLAVVLLIAGFARLLGAPPLASRRYLESALSVLAGSFIAAFGYAVAYPWIRPAPVEPPAVTQVALAAALLTLLVGGALAGRYLPAGQRLMMLGGISCFAAGDLVRLLGLTLTPSGSMGMVDRFLMAPPPVNSIYGATAQTLGVVLLGYLYVRTQSSAVRLDIATLEQKVSERTAALEAAMQELAVANSLLVEQSTVDSLTGVRNRRFFDEALRREWARCRRERRPLAVALIDVDHFKTINDRHGHQVGDECLVRVATALQGGARRPADVLARYGGDEFVLLLPGSDLEGARSLLDQVRSQIEGQAAVA